VEVRFSIKNVFFSFVFVLELIFFSFLFRPIASHLRGSPYIKHVRNNINTIINTILTFIGALIQVGRLNFNTL